MNKWLVSALAACALTAGSLAHAQGVDEHMKAIAKSYRTVLNADSPEAFKQGLTTMKQEAQLAQKGVPDKLEGKSPDSPEMKDFRHGLDELIGEIDAAQALADAGKLDQAKQAAEQFKATRDEYHKKYK